MKCILSLLLVLISCSAWAANYYVDFSTGNDANNGVSVSTAWQHSPGDDNAAGLAKSTVLHAGDIVYFKGGTVYLGKVSIKWAGTSGQPIIYDGNASNNFGSGKAIIDGGNTRNNGFVSSVNGMQQIIVRNFEIRNLHYNTNDSWGGSAAISFNYCSDITVSDCYIHDVGYWNNDGSMMPAGCGVYMIAPKRGLVTHCEITKTGAGGIALNGAQNCVVSYNNIHDYINWGIDIAGDYAVPTHNSISYNVLHDLYRYDTGFWGAAGDPPHQDYIFIRQGGGSKPVSNLIEGNLCYNNYSFTNSGGTAMTFLSTADSTIIRNNVYINPHSYYGLLADWGSNGTQMYNNTIYAPRISAFHLGQLSGCRIMNNLVVCSSVATMDYVADTVGLKNDYNIYYTVSNSELLDCSSPYKSWTFAQWQSLGYDTHSKKMAAIADIKFVNITGYPLACQTMDLHLQSSSPAIDCGANLSSTCTNDMDGTVRPQGIGWDMGALEYSKPIITAVQTNTINALPLSISVNGHSAQSVSFSLSFPEHGDYLLAVYDVAGKKIWSQKENAPAGGKYQALWRFDSSKRISNGIYFVKLGFQDREIARSFTVIK